jgi:NhaP-type Na+/H+ or K+/H+ antiporter
LLFAGALHLDQGDLAEQSADVAVLATLGATPCTLFTFGLTWRLLPLLDAP